MLLILKNEEVADIISCVEDRIEVLRETLKGLTEPDECYEHNDTQLDILRLTSLVNKLK